MTTALHKDLPVGEIHKPHSWEYANAAARTGASGFVAGDLGKFARQLDDNSVWMLIAVTPTWKQIDPPGGAGETNTASNVGTAGVGVFKQKTGVDLEFKKINAGSAKVTVVDDTGNDEVDVDVVTGTTADSVCVGNDSRLSDSRTPTSHASTHEPGGGDPMTVDAAAGTGSLRTLGTSATSACAGNDSRLSDNRTPVQHASSHQHGGSDEVATATPGANAIPKADGSGSLDAWVTHLELTSASPEDVTKAGADVGSASDAARADHKHDISTAVAVKLDASSANTEGAATSLARSDHTHEIDETGSISNIDPDDVAASGTAEGFARKDHTHGITTVAAGPIQIGASAAEGSADTFVRSDHIHSFAAPAAPVNVTKAAAAAGTATEAARADHKHDVTTGVPVATSTSNAEGTASSLARSDHVHALGSHGSTHENGGADEIDVTGLSGTLADPQTPSGHAASHQHGGSDEVATATAGANAIPKATGSGVLADGWVSQSSVTQHEGAIDHDALTNFDVAEHRVINDSGTGTTDLWSASKIDSEISAIEAGVAIKAGVDTSTAGLGNITLAGEQTLNGLLTSSSRVLVTDQTVPSQNGIYVSSSGSWARATDADEDDEVTNGNIVHVINSGSTKYKYKYLLVTPDPITVGVTAQTWEEHRDIDFGTTSGTATEGNDSRVPTQDENDALQGTSGSPSNSNRYVTNSDSRMTDARTPTSHASTHSDGGSDEIDVKNLGSTSAGGADELVRSDGSGGLLWTSAGTPGTIEPDDTAQAGSATTYARGDHQHAIAADTPGAVTPGDSAVEGSSTSFARADHQHSTPAFAAPGSIQPDDTVDAGSATTFARSDHRHGITADAPGAIEPGDPAQEGSASSFARSDHQHSVTAAVAGTIEPDDSAAEGSASSFARSDHQHAIAAAAPGAIEPDDTSVEGTATSFARSDHQHAITTSTPGTIEPDDTASEGSASSFARSDHQHAISAGTPTNIIGGASADEGTSTSFARADHVHGTTGSGTVSDVTKEPTGFLNRTDSVVSFAPSPNRRFTIAPAVSSFDFYINGTKFTKSSTETVDLTNTTGLWYIYYDNTGTLQASMTPWSFGNSTVFVALVYWNSAQATQSLWSDERHGLVMDWQTHEYLHRVESTRYVTGFAVSGYTLDSDTDAGVTFGIADGEIADEDIFMSIEHAASPASPFEQILADPCQLPVFYRDGTGNWVKDVASTFPFKNTIGRVNWNENTGGSVWQQTQATNNYFVAYWIFASNNPDEPVISVQGQREDSTLEDARANNDFNGLDLGSLPSSEWKLLYRAVYQTSDSFGGTRKAKLQAIDDYRASNSRPGEAAAAMSHSALANLGVGNDHPQYQLRSEKSAASGYASLDGSTKVPIAELPTGTPGAVQIGDSATEGTATSVARSDHTHSLAAPAAPADVTKAAASAGAATGPARADHKHDVSTAVVGAIQIGDSASEGAATSLARSDHTHSLAAPAAPADVTKSAASAGTSTSPARADHKHDISTAAAVGLSATTVNGPGTATSLARSDHTHAIDVSTGSLSSIDAGDTAADGTAAGLARRDHQHAVNTGTPGAIQPDDAAAEGTATTLARSDHTHSIVAAAPAQGVGGGNSEGSATSFSRSDHDHTIRETGGPTDLTVGSIPDGYRVGRSGSALVGVNPYDPYRTIVVATQQLGADATTIADAITAVNGLSPAPSASAPAVILVHPGVYSTPPFVLPNYVSLVGVGGPEAVTLEASTTTSALCTANGGSVVRSVTLKGANGVGGIGIDVGGTVDALHVRDCYVLDCTTGIRCSGVGKSVHILSSEVEDGTDGLLVDATAEARIDALCVKLMTNAVHIGSGGGAIKGNGIRVISHAGEVWAMYVEGSASSLTLTGSEFREDRTSYHASADIDVQHMSLIPGDEAMQVTAELHVGTENRPRESCFGGGDSHVRGMAALTNTNLEGGTWANITTQLKEEDGSPISLFAATAAGNCFYFGGDVEFPGMKAKVTAALSGGAVVLEYWNGSSWVSIPHMSTDADAPYGQYAQRVFQRINSEQIRFGTQDITGWATKSLNGITKYWVRFRVTSILTVIPACDRCKLHTDRTEINSDGVVEYFGAAQPVRQLIWHRKLMEELEGFAQPDADIDIASGLSLKAKANRWQNGNKDGSATLLHALPGLDTSRPITYVVGWTPEATGAGNVEVQLDVVTVNPGDVLDGTLPYTEQLAEIVTGPFTAYTLQATELDFVVPDLESDGSLAVALYRDASGGNLDDTFDGDAMHVYSAVYGTFWR